MAAHIVINQDRTITVPTTIRKLGVQYDHNANIITFDCPRKNGDVDMLNMEVYINYTLDDGSTGAHVAERIRTDNSNPDIMHFDWTITRNVTKGYGFISFSVCIKQTQNGEETYHWNTECNSLLNVVEGMEGIAIVEEEYPDIVTDLLTRMNACETLCRSFTVGNEVAY